ncbi:MAG TPA: sulfotransferase, partial [Thermoanaerobaculia bacterium]|nr:sulfotransferase [Thermoanaerobaculia bacterium]
MNVVESHQRLAKLHRRIFELQDRLSGESCTECVFVVGSPGTQTSDLSWALAEHPSLWTSCESHLFYQTVGPNERGRPQLREIFDNASAVEGGWLWTNDVGYEEFAACLGHGFDRLFLSRSEGKRWVDSSPENLLIADSLSLMFPRARFVHVVRDGRAVVRSMLASGLDEDWARDLRSACETWVHYVRAGLAFQTAHRDRVLEVRSERLAAEPEAELASILEFLHVDPHPGPLRFLRSRRPATLEAG